MLSRGKKLLKRQRQKVLHVREGDHFKADKKLCDALRSYGDNQFNRVLFYSQHSSPQQVNTEHLQSKIDFDRDEIEWY